jgi:hypothetical protein
MDFSVEWLKKDVDHKEHVENINTEKQQDPATLPCQNH